MSRKKDLFSFSILMASYNNAKYIETAIKSVISQTYENWELIIVDDCSPDNSNEIITNYLNDKRIKLIHHNCNQGYGGALKTAINNSKNEIIGILDADDKLHKKALEIIVNIYIDSPNYGFIYSTMWKCDSNLTNCKIDKDIKEIIPAKTFIFHPYISHFKTFRKKDYDKTLGFEITQKRSVDKDIIYKLEEVTRFKFVNIPLYYYRQHDQGISQGNNANKAKGYEYIAKYKTYIRRMNKSIPNYKKNEIILEYFKITFHPIIRTFIKFIQMLKIKKLIIVLLDRFPNVSRKNSFLIAIQKLIN